MTYMIEAKGLQKRYGDFTAVDGASFNINPGEIIGFLGPNGAGKTTRAAAPIPTWKDGLRCCWRCLRSSRDRRHLRLSRQEEH